MPYRNQIFTNGEVYHVFNRSIAKQEIFQTKRDYARALRAIEFYRLEGTPCRFSHFERLSKEGRERFELKEKQLLIVGVEVLAYCLMPNHVHFLLKQKAENGISRFMREFQNSHSKYFNLKNTRTGSLFQAMFKAVRIEDDSQLMHVSRYIHLNPVTAFMIKPEQLEDYKWSSYPNYMGKNGENTVNIEEILALFKDSETYKEFNLDFVDYERKLAQIKHMVFE